MKKAIFIDLDGTLLGSDRQISKRNLEAVNTAKAHGHEIVICTGRAVVNSKEHADLINCNYIIYSNGNIFDCKNQKSVYECLIPPDELYEIYKTVRRENVYIAFTSEGLRYADKPLPPHHVYANNIIVISEPIDKWIAKNKIVQMLIISEDGNLIKSIKEECLPKLKNTKIPEQSYSLSDPSLPKEKFIFFGIGSKDLSKGNGIKKLGGILGIPKENRIAIGDGFNDLTMFDECGRKVAMGNALPEVKNKADLITDTNDNDGVAKFLKSLESE